MVRALLVHTVEAELKARRQMIKADRNNDFISKRCNHSDKYCCHAAVLASPLLQT